MIHKAWDAGNQSERESICVSGECSNWNSHYFSTHFSHIPTPDHCPRKVPTIIDVSYDRKGPAQSTPRFKCCPYSKGFHRVHLPFLKGLPSNVHELIFIFYWCALWKAELSVYQRPKVVPIKQKRPRLACDKYTKTSPSISNHRLIQQHHLYSTGHGERSFLVPYTEPHLPAFWSLWKRKSLPFHKSSVLWNGGSGGPYLYCVKQNSDRASYNCCFHLEPILSIADADRSWSLNVYVCLFVQLSLRSSFENTSQHQV